ncbi:MAG: hypothetical protein ACKV1O_01135 [Saprospiraceae bacterium]
MNEIIKKIWIDPVWSKVISAIIILLGTIVYSLIKAHLFDENFLSSFIGFWTIKIDLWILGLVLFLGISFFLLKEKKPDPINKILSSSGFQKYYGVYEVFHFTPHTTGNPKIANAFLRINNETIEYVHKYFKYENGIIENFYGHFFITLKNVKQTNAPMIMILKDMNNYSVTDISGMCIGLGEHENCHPISLKVVLRTRKDITDFSIEKYCNKCSIVELTEEVKQNEPYHSIIKLLFNKCDDKDILF